MSEVCQANNTESLPPMTEMVEMEMGILNGYIVSCLLKDPFDLIAMVFPTIEMLYEEALASKESPQHLTKTFKEKKDLFPLKTPLLSLLYKTSTSDINHFPRHLESVFYPGFHLSFGI